jgi:hypothetical protein
MHLQRCDLRRMCDRPASCKDSFSIGLPKTKNKTRWGSFRKPTAFRGVILAQRSETLSATFLLPRHCQERMTIERSNKIARQIYSDTGSLQADHINVITASQDIY